jgi:hypothetical protein
VNPFDGINHINHIFTVSPQMCLNITSGKLEERKREASRRARMEFINNLEEKTRVKLRKKELQVYTIVSWKISIYRYL